MDITVILCTFNRSQSLRKALQSIAVSKLPESVHWEVLVVDNNSGDDTREVAERFIRDYPGRFRYCFEPNPGKSNALNTAIKRSPGTVLAFVDDDVVVEPTWLRNLTSRLDGRTWAGAGGRILPDWISAPPSWLPLQDRYALAPLAMFDPDVKDGVLDEPPFGTNMAFQSWVFEKYGGFRADLGPRPGSEIRNEDTEFGYRLLNAGEKLRYEPSAVVHHSVSENRLRKEYFLAWWFDKARADIVQYGIPTNTRWFVAGVPLYLFRRFAVSVLRWMVATSPSQRFGAKLKVWGKAGEIQECHRMTHASKSNRRDLHVRSGERL